MFFVVFGLLILVLIALLDIVMFTINLYSKNADLRNKALIKKDMKQVTLQTIDYQLKQLIL